MRMQLDRMLDDYDRGQLSRRRLMTYLTGIAAAMSVAPRGLAQSAGLLTDDDDDDNNGIVSTFNGTDVNHIALTVTDIGRSRDFYIKHLGLEVASQGPSNCFLRCSEKNFVALFKGEKSAMNHYCYSVEDYDAADAVEKLTQQGLKPRRASNRVYFNDPDGLEVQVAAKSHGV